MLLGQAIVAQSEWKSHQNNTQASGRHPQFEHAVAAGDHSAVRDEHGAAPVLWVRNARKRNAQDDGIEHDRE